MERDLASRFVHDLRNPINTVSINAELGKLALQRNQDPDKAIQTFEEILKQCQHCSNIIEEFVTAHIGTD